MEASFKWVFTAMDGEAIATVWKKKCMKGYFMNRLRMKSKKRKGKWFTIVRSRYDIKYLDYYADENGAFRNHFKLIKSK